MSSVATNAFAWALEYVSEWEIDDLERRVAFDLWAGERGVGPAATPGAAPAPDRGAIAEAAARLASGETSSVALVERALAEAELHNERLVGFVELTPESAVAEAQALDAERAAGELRGPLHGIPISVKDVIHVAGVPTRCGSDAFELVPGEDAWAVARLRESGAIILGKVATHEFALGVTSPQSRNPHDDTRIPGGSSGGSAVAVAKGMGFASLCTDTRASSRVPAALSGIVGFKPTYGTIPTRGVVPLGWTMDHVGVIASDVAGAATMMDALRDLPPSVPGTADGVEGMTLGLPAAAFEDVDPAVEASVRRAIAGLEAAGAKTIELMTPGEPDFTGANAGGMITSRCEAATFHKELGADRELYWPEVRDQLNAADDVLATEYLQAQRYRAWLRERMLAVFEGVDALVMPTVPVLAPPVEDADDYLTILSRNAILWSFVGFPAISVPAEAAPSGLPVGLQVVGAPYAERTLIAVAAAVEAL
jgi:aspartyl-tRNA(Asn)/glutamyl-tRNA(Gln) amidotransferase subunit A